MFPLETSVISADHQISGSKSEFRIDRVKWNVGFMLRGSQEELWPNGAMTFQNVFGPGVFQRDPASAVACSSGCASHSRTVPSSDPLASQRPSDEKATEVTKSVCPRSTAISCCRATFQSRTVSSLPQVAMVRPSGENAAAFIHPLCPRRNVIMRRRATSQIPRRPSHAALASLEPSNEKARVAARASWPCKGGASLRPSRASQR